jgi:hypothetical protein
MYVNTLPLNFAYLSKSCYTTEEHIRQANVAILTFGIMRKICSLIRITRIPWGDDSWMFCKCTPEVDLLTLSKHSYSKTNQMHLFIKLFILAKHSTYFGRSFRPSSGVQDCTYSNRHMSNNCCYFLLAQPFDICLLLYVQSWAPDDGRKDRPKYVECFARINNLINRSIWLVLL